MKTRLLALLFGMLISVSACAKTPKIGVALANFDLNFGFVE